MNRKYTWGVLALALSTLLTAGCFDIEQSLKFNKDMSGTAGFKLGIDFEPMIVIMTAVGRQMEGKKGPVPPEELAKAKADFLKQMNSDKSKNPQVDFKKDEAELQKGLPEGIKLVDGGLVQDGFKITTHFAFSFTDPSKLSEIQMPQKEGGDPTQKNVIDHPFDGFKVQDEGRTLLITSKPLNPAEDVEKQASEAPKSDDADSKEMEKMVKDAMKGLRVAFRIEAPFKVVESNATRKDGNALLWEYNLDTLEKMQKSGVKDAGIRVRYAK